jgi:hypothetical protein
MYGSCALFVGGKIIISQIYNDKRDCHRLSEDVFFAQAFITSLVRSKTTSLIISEENADPIFVENAGELSLRLLMSSKTVVSSDLLIVLRILNAYSPHNQQRGLHRGHGPA